MTHTLEQLQAMSDEELTVLVAEFMGWKWWKRQHGQDKKWLRIFFSGKPNKTWPFDWIEADGSEDKFHDWNRFLLEEFQPLKDWNHTMQVVDKTRGKYFARYPFILTEDRYQGAYSGGKWLASFGVEMEIYERGPLNHDTAAMDFWNFNLIAGPGIPMHPIISDSNPQRAICISAIVTSQSLQ